MATFKSLINNRIDNFASKWMLNRFAFNSNQSNNVLGNYMVGWDKPTWVSLSEPKHFEEAVRFNPVLKGAINILATAASNAKKIAIDINTGEEIPWIENDNAIKKAYQLIELRPNPLQSAREFRFQGVFYNKTFGNRYVNVLMPLGFDSEIDLLNIDALWNLPSQFMEVRTTGKIYNQNSIEGIISEYARTNVSPAEKYEPKHIIHFNEVNISSEQATVMGISKIEVLRNPLTNIQAAFEAMNSILTSRGMQGIISVDSKDGQGTIVPLDPNTKKEVDDKFKNDYGLLNGQNPFLISPIPLNYIKTAMNSSEMGIYKEFSNNAIIVNNELGVPPELGKTYVEGATYENQVQSVRRLYQDTVIPMITDEDKYMSWRLNTYKYGFEIQSTWDHIPALQSAFKEKAAAINLKGRTAKDAWSENIITRNQYLEMIEQPIVEGGDVLRSEWIKPNNED